MKKPALMIIMLIIISLPSFSQKMKDVLYLKNGSIIYGKLIEATSSEYKIQTTDGSLMIFPVAEVEKFTREKPVFEGRKENGFTLTLESGLLAGSQDTKYFAPFSFNILAGYTGNTRNIVSLGTGVEFFGRPYTPVFFEYKNIVRNSKTSPFVFFRLGGVMAIGGSETSNPNYVDHGPRDYAGGGSFALGTGISWAKEDFSTSLSFAYRYAHISYKQRDYNNVEYTYKDNLNRLEIKFGYTF